MTEDTSYRTEVWLTGSCVCNKGTTTVVEHCHFNNSVAELHTTEYSGINLSTFHSQES